eukprot:TRINITY_DN14737_c0_g1_i1.p1 TRINITY_DN14737_c0_g1~~TRINITY_DN14737_c0_g1_i1.p1  ORF type:complete len:437 (+),score=119.02 TRINITY_DN14737_c0_g1_i1:839-2149(+)
MLKLAVENLLLLGDHFQLQPLVIAKNHKEPEEKRVSRSLMERMLDAGYTTRMLKIQYRMFEGLCTIVSGLFYKSKLITAPEKLAQDAEEEAGGNGKGSGHFKKGASVEICWSDGKWYSAMVKRRHPQGGCYVDYRGESLYIPDEFIRSPLQADSSAIFADARRRLRWFDTSAKSKVAEIAVGTSYVNPVEVAMIRQLLLSDPVLKSTSESTKVITLYKPQLQLLQKTCHDIMQKRLNVEFVTVDACQGTEAAHIVLSPVRSSRGKIGFASNPRRLNVAISRAIKSLSIVGSSHGLCGDKNWAKVFAGFKNLGEVSPVNLQQLKSSTRSGWSSVNQEAEAMAECKASKVPDRQNLQRMDDFFGAGSGKRGKGGKAGKGCGKGGGKAGKDGKGGKGGKGSGKGGGKGGGQGGKSGKGGKGGKSGTGRKGSIKGFRALW